MEEMDHERREEQNFRVGPGIEPFIVPLDEDDKEEDSGEAENEEDADDVDPFPFC